MNKIIAALSTIATIAVLVLALRSSGRDDAGTSSVEPSVNDAPAFPMPPATTETPVAAVQRSPAAPAAAAARAPVGTRVSVVDAPDGPRGPVDWTPRLVALLDKKFQGEDSDPAWSNSATSRVAADLIQQLPAGSELVDVDCRQSMCRVKATHAGLPEHDQFARDVAKLAAEKLSGDVLATLDEGPGAETRTIAYLGRHGVPLPSLPTATLPNP